ncbi:MAG: hypothetical protein GY716_20515 [bacterium]|nr:hypothetical protein [bacterium]
MKTTWLARAALSALICGPAIFAQSVNIDLGNIDDSPPSSRYRAAGMPGEWIKLDALDPDADYPLFDLAGDPIVGTVDQFGGTEILEVLPTSLTQSGDHVTFMRDALLTHSAIENCMFYRNLDPGRYEILTYAWMPSDPTVDAIVRIDFENFYMPVIGGGPWTLNEQEYLLTYARHFIDVSGTGFLGAHSGVPTPATDDDYAVGAPMNGIQIRKLAAEVPLFPRRDELHWLASLDADTYDIVQGDLGLLRSTFGKYNVATQACVAEDLLPPNNLADLVAPYSADPAPGETQWFVVRGASPTESFTYDSGGVGQAGSRDLEIDSAAASCQ